MNPPLPRPAQDPRAVRYEALVQASMDGFWVADLQGVIREVNEAYCAMSGYPREALVGMPIHMLEALEQTPEEVQAHIQKMLDHGCDRFETLHRRKDGSTFHVEVNSVLQAEQGHFLVFLRDIQTRKEMDTELRRLNLALETKVGIRTVELSRTVARLEAEILRVERRERLLQAMTDLRDLGDRGDLSALLKGTVEAAQALTESRLGALFAVEGSPLGLVPQVWSLDLQPFQKPWVPNPGDPWEACLREGRPLRREGLPGAIPQGGWPRPLIRELVVPVVEGSSVVSLLVVADAPHPYDEEMALELGRLGQVARLAIQRLRANQDQIRASNLFTHVVLDSGEGIGIVDAEETWVFANPVAERIFGVGPGDLVGRNLREFMSPTQFDHVREQTEARRKGQQSSYDLEILRMDGEPRVISVLASPLEDYLGAIHPVFAIFQDVTEVRQHELHLKASETRYRTVADYTYDWEYWTSPQNALLYVSPSCERITGYTPGAFMSDAGLMVRLIHPEDRAAYLEHLDSQHGELGDALDFRILRPDGEIRWISHAWRSVLDERGQYLGRRGSNRDITERKRVEQALAQSEAAYRTLSEHSPLGIWHADASGRPLYVNRRWTSITGLSVQDTLSHGLWQSIHPEDQAEILEAWHQALGKGQPLTEHARILRSDGIVRWVRLQASPIEGEGQELGGYVGTVEDITTRFELEELWMQSQTLMANVQAVTGIGIFEWLSDPSRRYWSKEMHLLYDLPEGPEPPRRSEVQSRVHPEDWTHVQDYWKRVQEGEKTEDCTFRVQHRDGSLRHLVLRARSPLSQTQRGASVLGVVLDITARMEADQAQAEFEQMSAKAQLAAFVAHEINNPLAGIQNAFTLLESAIPPDHPSAKYGALVQREIQRIAGIVRSMTTPQAPGDGLQGGLRSLGDVIDLLTPKARRYRVALLVQERDPPPLRQDEETFRQILINLVQNAVEATPAGGSVVVRSQRQGDQFRVEVRDTGPGIPPDQAARIFNRGFTTKTGTRMSGQGMGLWLCRSLARRLGGTLTFGPNEEEATGTVFTLVLPIHNAT